MIVRQRLYRRRFPRALGPLIPSFRSLVSAAEVAHLLALPSARMKGVPVRRVTIPRIPAPPEVIRGSRRTPPRRAAGAHEPSGRRPPKSASRSTRPRHAVSGRERPSSADAGRLPARGPVSDAARRERRGADPPLRPQVRRAAGRRPGLRARPARCSPSTSTTSRTTTPRRS